MGDRSSDTAPLRLAVVGLGYWGPNLVRVAHESALCDLVAVCDRRGDALDRIGARYPSVRLLRDYDVLLADADLDAIAIATPVSTHFELAAQALRAGKHVFVEKPLAGSLAEAQELAALAISSDLLAMPGHTFLYSPPVVRIKQFVDEGTLGDIQFISASRVNLGLHQADVSVVWDLAPHDFSMLYYWLDQSPVRVSAVSRDCVLPGVPDVAFINLEYASGMVAHVELSWLAPSKLRRTAIVGSGRMIVYDDTSVEPVRLFDSGVTLPDPQTFGDYQLSYRVGDIVSPHLPPAEPLLLELEDFCRSVASGAAPRSSAVVGVEVIRAIDAVDRALASGDRVELASAGALGSAGRI
jgi:predicted dehydrogenase